jgi:uncharacterized ferritin-like protein (DUF455 family)
MELRQRAHSAFCINDANLKCEAVQLLWRDMNRIALDTRVLLPAPQRPGSPPRPELVHPQNVPRRSPFTPQGHAALVHSIAHIEFNAINLALDAVWRFADLPEQYYRDWMRVAQEEAKHFTLLRQHLLERGYDYGDFQAHEGLWTMCASTQHDVIARMALVPRTLEARGLDAIPLVQAKLRKVATPDAKAVVAILDLILQEEVGHVSVGNHWYHWLCQRAELDPDHFHKLASDRYGGPRLKPPFNISGRRMAGFTESEINALPTANEPLVKRV